jgi:two-component system KDP operon response regulator KdpE
MDSRAQDRAAAVLLVEDEPEARQLLGAALQQHGFGVSEAGTGTDGLREARLHDFDLVLLDLGLPDMDGLEVIGRLREWTSVPIIVLSARKTEQDKIGALDRGADDYMTKPFAAGELLARMRVALRRPRDGSQQAVFRLGDLEIDRHKHVVMSSGREVHLTPTEYRLLVALARCAGGVVTHRQLLNEVWGPTCAEQTQYLRVYMAQIRHKLEQDPTRPRYIVTEPGVGYRMRAE